MPTEPAAIRNVAPSRGAREIQRILLDLPSSRLPERSGAPNRIPTMADESVSTHGSPVGGPALAVHAGSGDPAGYTWPQPERPGSGVAAPAATAGVAGGVRTGVRAAGGGAGPLVHPAASKSKGSTASSRGLMLADGARCRMG